jgi:VWFA-related protein
MQHSKALVLPLLFAAVVIAADDDPIVFRSDVSLARVDAQVVDSHNRTITGLRATDFVLREDGKPQPIRNFASEDMPIDILLLLDVSASMRPHVERMADAAHDALRVLTDKDRVAIMVFDTMTRVRLGFRSSRSEINRGLSDVLNQERFNGGTHITNAMMNAADYVRREARPEARRAIIILTDDGSQDTRDDAGVGRALSRADAVLSFLQAPDVLAQRSGGGGGYPGGTGTTFPGGGWPGVILGGGSRRNGNGYPGGRRQVGNHSAGTADIARDSGGDVFPVDDASSLEDTLTRLRQRYALNYNSAATSVSDAHPVQVDLTNATRRRYPDAEIRYRKVFLSKDSREAGPISITRAHSPDGGTVEAADRPGPATGVDELTTPKRRRVAVDQSYGSSVNVAGSDGESPAAASPKQ